MPHPWENNSGCKDPTAYAATRPLSAEEETVSRLVHMFRDISRMAGLEITNRIEFYSPKTERTYR